LETSVEKFKTMENQIKFGMLFPVIYYKDLMQEFKRIKTFKFPENFFIDCFLKRKAFEHKKEIRLVTLNDEKCLNEKIRDCK